MDPRIETVLFFLAWAILRIGVPLLITSILVLWLRRLDSRWKEQAILEGEGQAEGSACWEVRGCPPERRAACPAYLHPEIACWQLFRAPDGSLKPGCLGCEVFRNATVPLRVAHRSAH